jgi:hypothetical protein
MSADTELASRDSSEEVSEAASENGNVRTEKVAAAFQGKGSCAYQIASPAPFLETGTEICWHDTLPTASGRRKLGVYSNPVENRKAMFLSEIHFQISCHHSFLETRGLG